MATTLTEAHHQWIREVSSGALDPAMYPPVNNHTTALIHESIKQDKSADATQTSLNLNERYSKLLLHIETEVESLLIEIGSRYKEQSGIGDVIVKELRSKIKVLESFDMQLFKDLAALDEQTEPSSRQEVASVCLAEISKYLTYLTCEDVTSLDNNPFRQLSISAEGNRVLGDLQRSLTCI